eukprot:6966631-Alexandrium_andersonii.AAC.1
MLSGALAELDVSPAMLSSCTVPALGRECLEPTPWTGFSSVPGHLARLGAVVERTRAASVK